MPDDVANNSGSRDTWRKIRGGLDFVTYSNLFLSSHLDGYFNYVLVNKFGIPAELAPIAAPFLRNATKAHFAGVESISPEEQYKIDRLASGGA